MPAAESSIASGIVWLMHSHLGLCARGIRFDGTLLRLMYY